MKKVLVPVLITVEVHDENANKQECIEFVKAALDGIGLSGSDFSLNCECSGENEETTVFVSDAFEF